MNNKAQIATFEKHERQIQVYHREISVLSKKRENDAVNKFKLALINSTLRELNAIIGTPLEGFEFFDENLLPTNSDVALVLAQYVSAVYAFRVSSTERNANGSWYWVINGKMAVETENPVHFQYTEK